MTESTAFEMLCSFFRLKKGRSIFVFGAGCFMVLEPWKKVDEKKQLQIIPPIWGFDTFQMSAPFQITLDPLKSNSSFLPTFHSLVGCFFFVCRLVLPSYPWNSYKSRSPSRKLATQGLNDELAQFVKRQVCLGKQRRYANKLDSFLVQ